MRMSCEGEIEKRPRRHGVDKEYTRARKRLNRVNANRNDYGNEGFLLMMLYQAGYIITLRRLPKEGTFQKLKIEQIILGNTQVINRATVESIVNDIEFGKNVDITRKRRIVTSIIIDNGMTDILKSLGFIVHDGVKKRPKTENIPSRRTLESVSSGNIQWEREEIINTGVQFYDNIKELAFTEDSITIGKTEEMQLDKWDSVPCSLNGFYNSSTECSLISNSNTSPYQ